MGLLSGLFGKKKPTQLNISRPSGPSIVSHKNGISIFDNDSVIISDGDKDKALFNGEIISSGYGFYFAEGGDMKSSNLDDAIALFTDCKMFYCKKFDDAVKACFLCSDGTALIYSDNNDFLMLSPDGKRQASRVVGIDADTSQIVLSADFCYICGIDGDDALSIFCFSPATSKSWRKVVVEDTSEQSNFSFSASMNDDVIDIKCSDGQNFRYAITGKAV